MKSLDQEGSVAPGEKSARKQALRSRMEDFMCKVWLVTGSVDDHASATERHYDRG